MDNQALLDIYSDYIIEFVWPNDSNGTGTSVGGSA